VGKMDSKQALYGGGLGTFRITVEVDLFADAETLELLSNH